MLAALSTAHKLGLGLSALAFILFALISSMVIPRRNPDYPGKRLGWFVFVSFLFFAWMMTAVLVFGREKHAPEKHQTEAISIRAAK